MRHDARHGNKPVQSPAFTDIYMAGTTARYREAGSGPNHVAVCPTARSHTCATLPAHGQEATVLSVFCAPCVDKDAIFAHKQGQDFLVCARRPLGSPHKHICRWPPMGQNSNDFECVLSYDFTQKAGDLFIKQAATKLICVKYYRSTHALNPAFTPGQPILNMGVGGLYPTPQSHSVTKLNAPPHTIQHWCDFEACLSDAIERARRCSYTIGSGTGQPAVSRPSPTCFLFVILPKINALSYACGTFLGKPLI